MKNTLSEIKCRLYTTEEKITEVEAVATESTQYKAQKKKTKQCCSELWNNSQQSDIMCYWKKKRGEHRKDFENINEKMFPNLTEILNPRSSMNLK